MTPVRGSEVSCVIPARDEDPAILLRTIEDLLDTAGGHRVSVVVVDDASRTPVDRLPRTVIRARTDRPLGVSRARRLGCALAPGEVLVSLDAHHTFAPGWLDGLFDALNEDVVVCPSATDYERRSQVMYGARLTWHPLPDFGGGRGRGFQVDYRYDPPSGVSEVSVDVPSVAGACMALTRRSYDKLGGFSPLFRVWGCDEQDISLRAHLCGLRVCCVPDSLVGHLYRRRFPYAGVTHDVLDFNQYVLIRSVLGPETALRLQRILGRPSPRVRAWLAAAPVAAWRAHVRRHAVRDDRQVLAMAGLGHAC